MYIFMRQGLKMSFDLREREISSCDCDCGFVVEWRCYQGIFVLVSTYASSRLVSFRLHLSNLKSQNSLSLSPLSSLFLNSRGFVGYPRKYDAGVFRAAGSYRDVHEMADAPTDSSEQKKNYLVYTRPREHDPVLLKASYVDMLVLLLGSKEAALKAIVSCSKSTFMFRREFTGSFEANLTGLQAKTLAGFPGIVMLEELKANLVIKFGV